MSIYNISGNQISNAYNLNGNMLSQAYDVDGVPLMGDPTLTVMTFNVKVFQEINNQQALLNEIISKYTPDIIGMQELGTLTANTLPTVGTNMLSNYPIKILSEHKQKDMMVSKSLSLSNFYTTDFTNQDPLDAQYYSETRSYMMADINIGGKTIKWINAHLCFETPSVKWLQMGELFDIAEQHDYVILTADFNSTAMTATSDDYINMYKQFVDAGYNLANNSPSAGFQNTWGSSTNPTSLADLTWACDSIITSSNIDIENVVFDDTKLDYLNGNQIDHIPVVAYITIT